MSSENWLVTDPVFRFPIRILCFPFLFQKLFSLSLEAEMFEQLHGVFISQEGGSVQWEGSNLENTERLMIIIGQ